MTSISFGELLVCLEFIVVEGYTFEVLISDPTMEAVMATLDYVTKHVNLKHESKVSVLDWLPVLARLTAEDL